MNLKPEQICKDVSNHVKRQLSEVKSAQGFYFLLLIFLLLGYYIYLLRDSLITTLSSEELRDGKKIFVLSLILAFVFLLFLFMNMEFRKCSFIKMTVVSACVVIGMNFIKYDLIDNICKEVLLRDFAEEENLVAIGPGERKVFDLKPIDQSFNTIQIKVLSEEDLFEMHLVNLDGSKIGGVFQRAELIDNNDTVINQISLVSEKRIINNELKVSVLNNGTKDILIPTEVEGFLNVRITRVNLIGYYLSFISIFLGLMTFITFSVFVDRHYDIAKVFLVIAIPLSCIYLLLFPPFAQPDTGSHFFAAYRCSNIILNYPDEQDYYGRTDDVSYYRIMGSRRNPSIDDYDMLMEINRTFCLNPTMVDYEVHEEGMEYYSIVNYWPEVLGFIIARLLNLGSVIMVYLGRILLLSFYIWAMYHAIKITPIGRSVFFSIALFPMCLMMSSGISYDGMAFLSSMNFIASILALDYDKTSKRKLIECSCWAAYLGAVKGGGFLFLLLPVVFVLFNSKDKKSIQRTGIVAGIGIVSSFFFHKIVPAGLHLYQFGEENTGKMVASYAFMHPISYLNMSVTSYVTYIDKLLLGAGGTKLGWLEDTLPASVIGLFYIVMLLLALYEDDPYVLEERHKRIFLSSIIISIASTPAMLLSFTNEGSRLVEGLQGRYYVPIIPLAVLLITKGRLKKAWSSNHVTICGMIVKVYCLISFVAVYYLLRQYLLR